MKRVVLSVVFASLLSAAAFAQSAAPEGSVPGGVRRPVRHPSIPPASLLMAYAPVAAPKIPGEEYGAVAGVALNSKGHLYVFQRTQNALIEFDEKGAFVRNFGEGLATRAHNVRVDASDNIWLVDDYGHTVTKLNPEGKVLLTLGVKDRPGTWNEATGTRQFNQPTDVAFAKNGDFYVSTAHGGPDPRIVRFDKTGKFLNTWSLAHEDGSRAVIHTVIVGPDGNVYAGDREAMKIRVFTPAGVPLRDIAMKNLVCGLYVDSHGDLWMTAGHDGMIMHLDWSGHVLGWTGEIGNGANEYGEAHYLAITKDMKTIYVSDTNNNKLEKLVLP
ncbi:MAG TPA: hypothetical protein VG735_15565 [Caulobacterales bacterium]|nr:hypothetical protein [Caulobacterales bacterium]